MKLSIIIPVYNKAPFLERCFRSVADQYDSRVEVIIVNDGSSDGSMDICHKWADKNGWRIFDQENRGVSAARNLGLDNATGEYVTFLDADDLLMPDATTVMKDRAALDYNIVQFRQFRCKSYESMNAHIYGATSGMYDFAFIPKYWVMVWNKIYKRSFLNDNNLRFEEGMQFGEDALFNAKCILLNNGLYHANQAVVIHCLDDKKSLCRGQLDLERIEKLDKKLVELMDAQTDPQKRKWMEVAINEHRGSNLFKKYGFSIRTKGNHDIVYFLKDWPTNEELRYSLRSVEQNWPYNKVWFCGGCPDGLSPDRFMRVSQEGVDKWNKVRNMIRKVCNNDQVTEEFWLFNDDFFVLKNFVETRFGTQYNGTLGAYIERIEKRLGGPDDYTSRLREAKKALEKAGLPTLNYEVHKPMLINRRKALEVLDKFPNTPCFRSLYGNYYGAGIVNKHDMKIKILRYSKMPLVKTEWDFVSTNDKSFAQGEVGEFIRDKFKEPSRFEG